MPPYFATMSEMATICNETNEPGISEFLSMCQRYHPSFSRIRFGLLPLLPSKYGIPSVEMGWALSIGDPLVRFLHIGPFFLTFQTFAKDPNGHYHVAEAEQLGNPAAPSIYYTSSTLVAQYEIAKKMHTLGWFGKTVYCRINGSDRVNWQDAKTEDKQMLEKKARDVVGDLCKPMGSDASSYFLSTDAQMHWQLQAVRYLYKYVSLQENLGCMIPDTLVYLKADQCIVKKLEMESIVIKYDLLAPALQSGSIVALTGDIPLDTLAAHTQRVEWTCPKCTFHNDQPVCKVCEWRISGETLGSSSSSSSSSSSCSSCSSSSSSSSCSSCFSCSTCSDCSTSPSSTLEPPHYSEESYWSCPQCTYINSKDYWLDICEMCQCKRPGILTNEIHYQNNSNQIQSLTPLTEDMAHMRISQVGAKRRAIDRLSSLGSPYDYTPAPGVTAQIATAAITNDPFCQDNISETIQKYLG